MAAPTKIYVALSTDPGRMPYLFTYSPTVKMIEGQMHFESIASNSWEPIKWVAEYEKKREFAEATKE